MAYNFKLTVEYDGANYHGWQKQKNSRTIQDEIEKAIFKITRNNVVLTGSGRTDAGVHALNQTANFFCNTNIEAKNLGRAIGSLVPEDIVIKDCVVVDKNFHARYDAKSKVYHYRILNSETPSAICRRYAWFIPKKLDMTAMKAAASHLPGDKDFKAFEASGSSRSSTIRRVNSAKFSKKGNNIVFEIEGEGFLRHMVRNIVGTLVDAGLEKISPDDIKNILASRDRSRAGITAPAHGLFLMHVNY